MYKQIIILFALISVCVSESAWGGCPNTFRPGVEFKTEDYLGKCVFPIWTRPCPNLCRTCLLFCSEI